MRTIVNTAAAVLLAATICYLCVMTNAQDCETERYMFITSENSSVNCSLVLSRVVNYVISRQFSSTPTSDLNLVCTTSNDTDVCQDGVMNYFIACRSFEVVSVEEQAISYGCTIDPISESYCANTLSLSIDFSFRFISLREVFSRCVTNYFDGFCSSQCNSFLRQYAQPTECCYNEALKTFFGNSTSFPEDQYEIVANNIFTLCNLTNPGFCTNTPVPSSLCSLSLTELFQNNSTRECRQAIVDSSFLRFQTILGNHAGILSLASIPRCLELYLAYLENCNDFTSTSSRRGSERACLSSAITMFGQNNTCGNTADPLIRTIRTSSGSFRTFEDILEVQNASEIMCRIPECTDNLKSYINSCNIHTNLTDLLCHGHNGRSCLALQQSGVLNTLTDSLYERYNRECFATVISACTSSCREIITEARDNAGCCAYEYLRFLIIENNLTHIYSADQLYEACSVDGGRCGLVTDDSSTVVAHCLSVGIFIIMSILSM